MTKEGRRGRMRRYCGTVEKIGNFSPFGDFEEKLRVK
jgi:hypothetical protein